MAFSPVTAVLDDFAEHDIENYHVGHAHVSYREGEKPPYQLTATHVHVHAICRDSAGDRWSLWLVWKTLDDRTRQQLIPLAQIVSDWQALISDLADKGLILAPEAGRYFRAYLTLAGGSPDLARVRLQQSQGFFPLDADRPQGEFGFMMPWGPILPENWSGEALGFFPPFESPTFAAYHAAGDLAGWQESIAPASGNPLLVFAACLGLAAPLLPVIGGENVGFHAYGLSSSGKSTAGQVAVSCWGCAADPMKSRASTLFQTWASTANGLEVQAAAASGGLLFLDELASMPQGIALPVYALLNGKGKTRMTAIGGMRAQLSWKVMVFSTGELSVYERIQQEPNRKVMTGEMVRFLELPVDTLPRDPAMTQEAAQTFAESLKLALGSCYGVAGPAFVQELMANFPTLAELASALSEDVETAYLALCTNLGRQRPLMPPHKRALRHFAFVQAVGVWASGGVLPFSSAVVNETVLTVASAWLAAFPILSDADQLLCDLRSYLDDHRFELLDTANLPTVAPASTGLVLHDGKLCFSPVRFEQAVGKMNAKAAGKLLDRLGILHRHDGDGQHKTKLTVKALAIEGERYYAVYANRLLSAEQLVELLAREVRQGEQPRRRSSGM